MLGCFWGLCSRFRHSTLSITQRQRRGRGDCIIPSSWEIQLVAVILIAISQERKRRSVPFLKFIPRKSLDVSKILRPPYWVRLFEFRKSDVKFIIGDPKSFWEQFLLTQKKLWKKNSRFPTGPNSILTTNSVMRMRREHKFINCSSCSLMG